MYKNRLTSLTKTLEIPLMSDWNLVTDIKKELFWIGVYSKTWTGYLLG